MTDAHPTARDAADRTLEITRIFDAPRALLFELWTTPGHYARWCAPARFAIVGNGLDARPGGSWWSKMEAPDGEICIARGEYVEVRAPERLVFNYAHELPDGSRGPATVVTVTFEDAGGKTRLTLHQAVFDTVGDRDAHVMGWRECLDRLGIHIADTRGG